MPPWNKFTNYITRWFDLSDNPEEVWKDNATEYNCNHGNVFEQWRQIACAISSGFTPKYYDRQNKLCIPGYVLVNVSKNGHDGNIFDEQVEQTLDGIRTSDENKRNCMIYDDIQKQRELALSDDDDVRERALDELDSLLRTGVRMAFVREPTIPSGYSMEKIVDYIIYIDGKPFIRNNTFLAFDTTMSDLKKYRTQHPKAKIYVYKYYRLKNFKFYQGNGGFIYHCDGLPGITGEKLSALSDMINTLIYHGTIEYKGMIMHRPKIPLLLPYVGRKYLSKAKKAEAAAAKAKKAEAAVATKPLVKPKAATKPLVKPKAATKPLVKPKAATKPKTTTSRAKPSLTTMSKLKPRTSRRKLTAMRK